MNLKYSVSFIVTALLLFRIFGITCTVIYILPTEPIDTPCPSGQNTCFTLNKWIESSTHPFTNGMTVMLLGGIHFINSTLNFLLIENVASISFSGQLNRDTTVECNYRSRFGFKFYNIREVSISNIQIKSCTALYDTHTVTGVFVNLSLAFIESQHIMLTNVKISKGGVLAEIYSEEGSAFQIHSSMLNYSSFVIQAWSKLNICIERAPIQNIPNNKKLYT